MRILKNSIAALLVSAIGLNVLACTGVVVGKDVSKDRSIIISRTEDISSAYNKNYIVVPAMTFEEEQVFEDIINGFAIEMPK